MLFIARLSSRAVLAALEYLRYLDLQTRRVEVENAIADDPRDQIVAGSAPVMDDAMAFWVDDQVVLQIGQQEVAGELLAMIPSPAFSRL